MTKTQLIVICAGWFISGVLFGGVLMRGTQLKPQQILTHLPEGVDINKVCAGYMENVVNKLQAEHDEKIKDLKIYIEGVKAGMSK